MHFVTHLTIALISLVTIVFSCILFTNAIEFLGNKLKLGNNATGSILAVIGTGLPEFIVPLVAIFGAHLADGKIKVATDIALGAILGSPFMLLTLALFLLSFVLIFKKRTNLNVNISFVVRNYKYILIAYLVALIFSFEVLNKFKFIAVFLLLILYGFFVYRTILKSRSVCVECECEKLYLKLSNKKTALFIQLFFSVMILILSSHFFVNEIKYFSVIFAIHPTLLALIVTPFATELPECVNSVIWLKQNKDDLALANILGAVVFQVTLLFALGIILTSWKFSLELLINVVLVIFGFLFFGISILKNKIISLKKLIFCGILYFAYLLLLFTK